MCERSGREVLCTWKCSEQRSARNVGAVVIISGFALIVRRLARCALMDERTSRFVNDDRDWSRSGHHLRPSVRGLSKCRRGVERMTRKVDDAKPTQSPGRSISLRLLNLRPPE
jgi:hypothetical protein